MLKFHIKLLEEEYGDIASCYASCKKASDVLGFKAEYNIEDMCKDSYNFVLKNK